MYNDIYNLPKHIKDAQINFENHCNIQSNFEDIDKIVILGMGGSAITGLFMKELYKNSLKIPIHIVQNYDIPNWINEKTLIIASSYSGNTEETLISCKKCIDKNVKNIIGFTTGGKLLKLLNENNITDYVKLPIGLQPRAAIGYTFTMMINLFYKINFINKEEIELIDKSINHLESLNQMYSKNNESNIAFKLSKIIYKKNPIIYTEDGLFNVIAYRLKSQLAENSKILSFNHSIPEMNHNEIEAFVKNINDNFILIWIEDESFNPKNIKRMKIVSKILAKKVSQQLHINIPIKQDNMILKCFCYINLVDWISYHCSILNEVNCTEIPNINLLKKSL